jgi:disulfide bond formation protein DsbB
VVGLGEDQVAVFQVVVLPFLELFFLHALSLGVCWARWSALSLLLAFAWIVALVATLGSLYYSEVRLFLPCELCWYQRIFMYPQAVILGLALWRQDFGVWPYSLALSLIGGSLSTLHLLEQKFPNLFTLACKPPVPCSVEYIPQFPIPLQALIAFALIALSMALLAREARVVK